MDAALPMDEEDHASLSESRLGRSGLISTPDSGKCSEVTMSQCQTATSEMARPSIRYSVHERGEAEAQRHKWIESEKAGRDLGNWAILCWIRYHWNGFLRERWLEHLQGRSYWYELDRDDYGLLQRAFQGSELIDEILYRLKSGAENLDVLNWAIDSNQPMDEVLEILEKLDINSRRIECLLQDRLCKS